MKSRDAPQVSPRMEENLALTQSTLLQSNAVTVEVTKLRRISSVHIVLVVKLTEGKDIFSNMVQLEHRFERWT